MPKKIVFAVALLLPGLALAQVAPARTVDMTTPIHDIDGGPFKDPSNKADDDPKCDKCPVMTVGEVIVRALYNANDSDNPTIKQDGEKLWKRGILAMRIKGDKAAVLTTEEVAQIKNLITRAYPFPLLISQIFPLLNPNDQPSSK